MCVCVCINIYIYTHTHTHTHTHMYFYQDLVNIVSIVPVCMNVEKSRHFKK